MRGKSEAQTSFCTLVNLETRIPADHPLRAIKRMVDEVLARMTDCFNDVYAEDGRRSIPPEQLLKAKVLMALHSVRSERLFCEQLRYNLLWLWFLDRELDEESWHPTSFTHNQERVLSSDGARMFFAEVYELSRRHGWTSDEHFTVDGTLIQAWASMKSFVKQKEDKPRKRDDDPGNPSVDFRGQKRSNQTHQSTTDPEAVLYRKSGGQESKLCFGAHALMENRHGLCADITIHNPIRESETDVALSQLDAHPDLHEGVEAKTAGADKGYHQKVMVQGLRDRGIRPHVACREDRSVEGLDGRTTGSPGYETSLRIRKRIEEIFGWIKTVGGFRRTRYVGKDRTQAAAYFVAASYNLVRMARLSLDPPMRAAPA